MIWHIDDVVVVDIVEGEGETDVSVNVGKVDVMLTD